jgi:hypothetical protein
MSMHRIPASRHSPPPPPPPPPLLVPCLAASPEAFDGVGVVWWRRLVWIHANLTLDLRPRMGWGNGHGLPGEALSRACIETAACIMCFPKFRWRSAASGGVPSFLAMGWVARHFSIGPVVAFVASTFMSSIVLVQIICSTSSTDRRPPADAVHVAARGPQPYRVAHSHFSHPFSPTPWVSRIASSAPSRSGTDGRHRSESPSPPPFLA